MDIRVKFREGYHHLEQSMRATTGVGIEVGKGVLAVFPGGSNGDGSCMMYPLDIIETIEVLPEKEKVVPIRANTN